MAEQRSTLTELLQRPRVPVEWGRKYTLWVHDDNISDWELILNPDLFSGSQVGSFVLLHNPETLEGVAVRITSLEGSKIFRQRSFQLSLHNDIARRFGFHARKDVYVRPLDKEETPIVKYVTVIFRDQYIGRLPMRELRQQLFGSSVYVGKKLNVESACIKARLTNLQDDYGMPLNSGLLLGEGEAVVRYQSETAKIFIFLQVAKESLQWDERTGMTMAEKAIDGFLAELFNKWRGPPGEESANHLVSIILFCRRTKTGPADVSQTKYEDRYSVIVDWEMHEDWQPVLCRVRKKVMNMLQAFSEGLVECRRGNILEAIHLALMIFDKHYTDRDLSKTGMSIICILPGGGLLEMPKEKFDLLKLAKRKVLDSGVWLQLICLAERPLHYVPLIEFTGEEDGKYYHPYWMNIMHYEGESQWGDVPKTFPQLPKTAIPADTSHSYESITSVGCFADVATSDPCKLESYNPQHCLLCGNLWGLFGTLQQMDWNILTALPVCPLRCPITLQAEELARSFELIDSTSHEVCPNNLLLMRDATTQDLLKELVDLRVALGFLELHVSGLDGAFLYLSHEIHRFAVLANNGRRVLVEVYKKKKDPKTMHSEELVYSAGIKAKNQHEYHQYDFAFHPFPVLKFPWQSADRIIAGGEEQSQILRHVHWQSRFVLLPADEAPRESLIMASVANEIFDDEELRIAGFAKFIEVFQRIALSRVTNPATADSKLLLRPIKEKDLKISAMEFLKIPLTTSSCSAYAQQLLSRHEASGNSLPVPSTRLVIPGDSTPKEYSEDDDGDPNYVGDVEPLRRDTESTKVVVLMQHPLVGLNIKNRRWHWRIYRNVFVGSEAVDWILKFFDNVSTREEAVELGNVLIDEGIWDHIFGTHRFLDGYYYYRFSPTYDLGTLRKSDPFILRRVSSTDNASGKADEQDEPGRQANGTAQQRAVVMSRCVLIDIAGNKRGSSLPSTLSHKQEWAILHYDSSHNPKNAYHFRLHWLTCSARLIDDLIQSWGRRAAQCGFALVEAPVELHQPPGSGYTGRIGVLSAGPFYQPLAIHFVVRPPSVRKLNEQLGAAGTIAEDYFIAELLRQHGFTLDFESDDRFPRPTASARCVWSYARAPNMHPQYIHQTGVAIVQIVAGDGENQELSEEYLLWSTNRLLLSAASATKARTGGHQALRAREEELLAQVSLLCADPVALGAFWKETLRLLGQSVGVEPILDDAPVVVCDDDGTASTAGDGDKFVLGSPESILHRISHLDLGSTL